MDIASDDYRNLRPQLRDRSAMAPREAVGALLTFGIPSSVITLQTAAPTSGRVDWLLVARVPTGLVIVEAGSADDEWTGHATQTPADASLSAAWFPLEAITSVSIVDLRVYDAFADSILMTTRNGWRIVLAGRDRPVLLERVPTDLPEDTLDKFCAELIAARGSAA